MIREIKWEMGERASNFHSSLRVRMTYALPCQDLGEFPIAAAQLVVEWGKCLARAGSFVERGDDDGRMQKEENAARQSVRGGFVVV